MTSSRLGNGVKIGRIPDARPPTKRSDDDAAGDAAIGEQGDRDPGRTHRWALNDAKAWDGEFREVLEGQLGGPPPEAGQSADEVLELAVRQALRYAARLDHPRFFGFIPSSPTWPAVVADFLAAGFNINSCTWLVSSGTSQVELEVTDWMRRWIGFPETGGGLMTSGGSSASVEAMVVAREAAAHPERASVYMSDQSHSALKRAALIAGVRREHIRLVPTGDDFRIDLDALTRLMGRDRDAGLRPVAVCANAGTAGTGSIDPLPAMADLCGREDVWLHADAAYGGFALVTRQGRELLDGIERADSVSMDAHKWFFQPYEAGALMVRDKRHLENAFAIGNDVLQDTVWGANHPNFADRGQQLSRAARALKIWMSVRTFGMARIRAAIQQGLDLARRAAAAPHRRMSDAGADDSRDARRRLFPGQPGRRRLRRGHLGETQPEGAGTCLLGRTGVPLFHFAQRGFLAAHVHPEPHNDMGRRSQDA